MFPNWANGRVGNLPETPFAKHSLAAAARQLVPDSSHLVA
jgi:hypothetical protein